MPNKINREAPHQSMIVVKAQIMEKTNSGRMSGVPCCTICKIYTVEGKDYETCVQNTEQFIANIGDKNAEN